MEESTQSEDYARASMSLGVVLARRPKPTAEELKNARELISFALTKAEISQDPDDGAWARIELAKAHITLARHPQNPHPVRVLFESAVVALEGALRLTPRRREGRWADIHARMGYAHSELADDGSVEHVQASVRHFRAALTVITRQSEPRRWANIHAGVAKVLFFQSSPSAAEYGEIVTALEHALEVITQNEDSIEWADLQLLLGEALTRHGFGDTQVNLKMAIDAYRRSLSVDWKRRDPEKWAFLHYSLGLAYKKRADGDRQQHLKDAVAAFEAALAVFPRESEPLRWWDMVLELSLTLSERQADERVTSIRRAKELLEPLIQDQSLPDSALHRTVTRSLLGKLYLESARDGVATDTEKALAMFEASLDDLDRHSNPIGWAGIQALKAAAYSKRVFGDKKDNSTRAIEAYQAALTVYTRVSNPTEWAAVQLSLGQTLLDSGDFRDAERAFGLALEVYTRATYPREWAQTQIARASLLLQLGPAATAEERNRGIALLQEVTAALPYREPDDIIAGAYLGLANAYLGLADEAYVLRHALVLASVEQALRTFRLSTHPLEYLRANRLLGTAHMRSNNWHEAWDSFIEARRGYLALSALNHQGGSGRSYAREHAKSLFSDAAFVAVKRSDLVAAWDWINYGKAIGLHSELDPRANDEVGVLTAKVKLWTLMLESVTGEQRTELALQLDALQKELSTLATTTESGANTFLGQLLSGTDAVATAVFTDRGGAILVAAHPRYRARSCTDVAGPIDAGADSPRLTALIDASMTYDAFSSVLGLNRHAGQTTTWLERFTLQYSTGPTQLRDQTDWIDAVRDIGPRLWRLLGESIVRALTCAGVPSGARLLWMPHAESGVLPIGLAKPDASAATLLERYRIHHAPNLKAAARAQSRAKQAQRLTVGLVINPTGDLHFAGLEARAIKSLFPAEGMEIFDKTNADAHSVLAALSGPAYWHFSTHGRFDFLRPLESGLVLMDKQPLSIKNLLFRSRTIAPGQRLVFLAACETGLFDISRNPDDFVGLPTAFMAVGFPAVIGSLWQVDDAATMFLSLRFYRLHLRQGLPPADALRTAQLWLRSATETDFMDIVDSLVTEGAFTSSEATLAKRAVQFGDQRGGSRFETVRKLIQDRHRRGDENIRANRKEVVRPFAHPYYWAGFIAHGF